MAENGVTKPTIGIILDGTGYGLDGSLWGGEVLIGDYRTFERYAWLEPVPMPGGAQAIHQPWRMALSYLYHAYGDDIHSLNIESLCGTTLPESHVVIQMIQKKLNSPLTSGCGRLFDGVAALLGLKRQVSYEAQAAMLLEMAIDETGVQNDSYADTLPNQFTGGVIGFSPLIRAIVDDVNSCQKQGIIAARFHRTLVELFVQAAISARTKTGLATVGLSGGVFQNVYLFEHMVERLLQEKFTVLTHRQVPANDGGIALGQVVIADALTR